MAEPLQSTETHQLQKAARTGNESAGVDLFAWFGRDHLAAPNMYKAMAYTCKGPRYLKQSKLLLEQCYQDCPCQAGATGQWPVLRVGSSELQQLKGHTGALSRHLRFCHVSLTWHTRAATDVGQRPLQSWRPLAIHNPIIRPTPYGVSPYMESPTTISVQT